MLLHIRQIAVISAAVLLVCMNESCNGPDKFVPNYKPAYTKDSSANIVLLWGCPSLAFYEKHVVFCQYLNKRLPGNIRLQAVAANSLADFIEKFSKKKFDIAITNGVVAVRDSKNAYSVIAKFVNDNDYRGLIITRKNVSVKKVSDLKGKTIACPGPDALAGTQMPLYYLATHGLDLNKDIAIVHVASFESVYMNVYLGKSYAGTTWLSDWKTFTQTKPEIAAALTPRFVTESLPNVALLIRSDIPANVQAEILGLIMRMNKDPDGKKLLSGIGTTAFRKADRTAYKTVISFMDRYSKIAPGSTRRLTF